MSADPLDFVPPPTRGAWRQIAPILPAVAYLMGGTALAVQLRHRESVDLDFFLEAPVDLARLAERLSELGQTDIQLLTDDTLNCFFSGNTKLQFLEASTQRMIVAPTWMAGVRVGSLPDLMATKLVALLGRPAIRDYVDLWALETRAGLLVEQGLALVEERYPRATREQTWRFILRALGTFDDVQGDPMPALYGRRLTTRQLERYWQSRVPQIAAALDDRVDGAASEVP
jgi:hypothetical protein